MYLRVLKCHFERFLKNNLAYMRSVISIRMFHARHWKLTLLEEVCLRELRSQKLLLIKRNDFNKESLCNISRPMQL